MIGLFYAGRLVSTTCGNCRETKTMVVRDIVRGDGVFTCKWCGEHEPMSLERCLYMAERERLHDASVHLEMPLEGTVPCD
jgi:hypothetical protein